MGKVIHLEMCKKFKFDHANKWYMHNPAPVLENDTHKLLWDIDIQTDHLISTRRPDLIVVFWPFDPAQNAIQGDAPEGSDTFQWQLGEEIAWAEIG